jgi:glycosyltransferase involved in cell wall biosynthesis
MGKEAVPFLPPSSLHVSNIANVAYGYAKNLARHGGKVKVICHDAFHLMSQPEWEELDLDPADFPDENDFRNNTADLSQYQRPSWFMTERLAPQRSKLHASVLGFAIRHLPANALRALEPLYYRALRLREATVQGAPFAQADRSSAELPDNRIDQLASLAARLGPEWKIDPVKLARYRSHGAWVSSYAKEVEVVFSYAWGPVYQLFVPERACISVEIGTMRDIPFGHSALARLLWLAYRLSDHVIITNPDAREIAERVGIRNYSFCPHPIDVSILQPSDEPELRQELKSKYNAEVLLFAPARQNWALKGNQHMLRGFSAAVRQGVRAALLIPGWGQELTRSKALCRELGIEAAVAWLRPMPERLLARYFRAVDIVLDQFQLGVFGLITPKAMACGAVVLTSYNKDHNGWCFPVPPPIVACCSPEEISAAIVRLAADPSARQEIRARSLDWMWRYYSPPILTDCLKTAMEAALSNFRKRTCSSAPSHSPQNED